MIYKDLRQFLIIIIFAFQIVCVSSAQQQTFEQVKTERKPFQKSLVIIKSPLNFTHREFENSKSYDPKLKLVLIDEKSGKYELRWIGYDGKEKVIEYQRHDAIDASVEAKVEKTQEGKFIYKYLLKVSSTSPSYLSGFIIQSLAKDTKPLQQEKVFVIDMFNEIQLFKDGKWWLFAFIKEEGLIIDGGKQIEIQLVSSSHPGIVGCKARAGETILKGVGEHIPYELESALPGYEGLASGYTIGPVESLSALSKSERAKYLLDNLPKFQETGWMSEGTLKNYETILKKEDLSGAYEKAKKDLESEFITSEVFQIIEGLNQ